MFKHDDIRRAILAIDDGIDFECPDGLIAWMKEVKWLDESCNITDSGRFTAEVVRCDKVWNLYENGRIAAGVASMSWLDRINGMRQLSAGLIQIKVQESLVQHVVPVQSSGLNLRNN